MPLTDAQKQEVAQWIASGARLSEVQQRLADAFGVRLTYMEARFLMDDLSLVPQEKETPATTAATGRPAHAAGQGAGATPLGADGGDDLPLENDATDDGADVSAAALSDAAPGAANVRVELDSIMRPGALVSGKVTFSDGVTADWQLDQMGRFGMLPSQEGYRPGREDLLAFQKQLQNLLARQGY